MARVFTNAFFSIAGTDLSTDVKSVTLNASREVLDGTTMGATGRVRLGGLTDWSIDIEFEQNYAASRVDVTVYPLYALGTAQTVILRADAGATSATNPQYTGTGIIESYVPVGGSVGETQKAGMRIVGSGALARATS